MDALWMIAGAVVLSVVATLLKSRRSTPASLGYLSRDWVMRQSDD
jgi:hypothetical protein